MTYFTYETVFFSFYTLMVFTSSWGVTIIKIIASVFYHMQTSPAGCHSSNVVFIVVNPGAPAP